MKYFLFKNSTNNKLDISYYMTKVWYMYPNALFFSSTFLQTIKWIKHATFSFMELIFVSYKSFIKPSL